MLALTNDEIYALAIRLGPYLLVDQLPLLLVALVVAVVAWRRRRRSPMAVTVVLLTFAVLVSINVLHGVLGVLWYLVMDRAAAPDWAESWGDSLERAVLIAPIVHGILEIGALIALVVASFVEREHVFLSRDEP